MRLLARLVAIAFLASTSLSLWAAAPPSWINFQGRLLDNNGVPVTQANMAFVVKIWSDPTSTLPANLKYSESHTVNVDDGVYSFPVGSGTPISGIYGGSLYANNNVLWLEVTVQGETLLPRHRLLSAPYTNHAGNSENLAGLPVSYFGSAATDVALQGQIDGLQGQINNLPGSGALQSLCEATGNIWDVDKCYTAITVIDFQGKIVPVGQDAVQEALPDLQKECNQKHYRPVLMGETPMEAKDCDSNPVEPPGTYGCGYGTVIAATRIKLDNCLFMKEQQQGAGGK